MIRLGLPRAYISGMARPEPEASLLAHLHLALARPLRAPEKSDEVAPVAHSITSSARAMSVGGISRPSAFAVLRGAVRRLLSSMNPLAPLTRHYCHTT